MDLKATCPYCKTLDLSKLMEDQHSVSDNTRRRLIRYYCNCPDSSIDYCPYCGSKESCPYYRD